MQRKFSAVVGVMAFGLVLLPIGGCTFARKIDDPAPKGRALDVRAEYKGLENQTVAVVVDADSTLLQAYPLAQLEVSESVSQKLAANVPGIKVVQARQVADFQRQNIYWHTSPLGEIAKRLGVSRLVLIELTEFRMTEPGTPAIWRGYINGNVSVAESDGASPNDRAFDSQASAAYPPDKPLGALKVDERTFRMATLDLFALQVAGKFYDHTERGR